VNFYISLENRNISAAVWLISTKCGIMIQNECSSSPAITKINFKNLRWRTTDALEKDVLHHHNIVISQFSTRWLSAILDFRNWNVRAVHFRDVFYSILFSIIVPNLVEIGRTHFRNIAVFHTFLVKCEHSLDDCAERGVAFKDYWIIFSN